MPPSTELAIRNRQRLRRVDVRRLKQIVETALEELGCVDHEIAIHLVGPKEMAGINWQFLQHEGSTDVITFDHSDAPKSQIGNPSPQLRGEIFICLQDAITQAREFKTTWPSEVVRYAVHGLLHLLGHDDLRPVARRKMKQAENRLVARLGKQFPLARVAR